ncbi:MAG: hypothetical protein IPM18_16400 [Phycisphaerales bacterium]|nr:hypothetical protein [Phycisphaerales bacterium]
MRNQVPFLGALALLGAVGGAFVPWAAGGVKLITLPVRERVVVQLDHMNVTLVEEERIVPLSAGLNEVVFAWTNTSVDAEAIQFRCLTDPDHIKVLSVAYPPNEASLRWAVYAPEATSARVRITYPIHGLAKSYAYRAEAAGDEQTLTLRQYIDLHNQANEAFGFAGMWTGYGERFERPIDRAETRQVLAARYDGVAIEKAYTADLAAFGMLDPALQQLLVPMHYVLHNTDAGGLGQSPLPRGKARLFQDDGRGGRAFLGEDWANFTPRDDELRLYLGVAKDVVVKRTIARREAQRVAGNLHHYDVVVQYEIENFKDSPVTLDLVETVSALRREIGLGTDREAEWELGPDGTVNDLRHEDKTTADRVAFRLPLPAREGNEAAQKVTHKVHIRLLNEW